jgi:hypothetical protein
MSDSDSRNDSDSGSGASDKKNIKSKNSKITKKKEVFDPQLEARVVGKKAFSIQYYLTKDIRDFLASYELNLESAFMAQDDNLLSEKYTYINHDYLLPSFVHIVANEMQKLPVLQNKRIERKDVTEMINNHAYWLILPLLLALRVPKLFGSNKESYEIFYGLKTNDQQFSNKNKGTKIKCLPYKNKEGILIARSMTRRIIKSNTKQVCNIILCDTVLYVKLIFSLYLLLDAQYTLLIFEQP